LSTEQKRLLIERPSTELSIAEQCEVIGLGRSSFYYEPCGESDLNLQLMRLIDEIATDYPFYGSPRITDELQVLGYGINRKRVVRLMKLMGLEAVYPKPRLSKPEPTHLKYPYLLRDLILCGPNHVWGTDITYIRMRHGFLYLTAIIDWFSRFVLAWKLSNSLDTCFCLDALEDALTLGVPEISNSDQGSQFTSAEFTGRLKEAGIRISMDGRGRALDNVFTERLWRSVKYEEVYLYDYESGEEAYHGLDRYFTFYNYRRRHSSLGRRTPADVYFASCRK
jgi:putative transposase